MKLLYPLSFFLVAGSLFAASPFDGTWKLNIAKSKFGGSDKPPKEVTVMLDEKGGRLEVAVKGTAADGSPISYRYSTPQTGGAFDYSEGAPTNGSSGVVAKRKADSSSIDLIFTRDGKVIAKHHIVVSNDGKSMEQTVKATDAQGKPFETVNEYDKM
jgi:hypothetical protein